MKHDLIPNLIQLLLFFVLTKIYYFFKNGNPEVFNVSNKFQYNLTLYDLIKTYGSIVTKNEGETITIANTKLFSVENALIRLKQILKDTNDWKNLLDFIPKNIKNELEELGFQAMYPLRYRALKGAVKQARGNRKEVIENTKKEVESRLAEAGIKAETTGREKHLYSIYQKMKNKELMFNEVMDIYAFRVIVDSVDHCYRALGAMHGLYKPIDNRFKDYIAIPRTNGYQSLHTSLIGPHGIPVEIQIRTSEMHKLAEFGVAAHWKYKSGGNNDIKLDWLHNLQYQNEYVEDVYSLIKNDLYSESFSSSKSIKFDSS